MLFINLSGLSGIPYGLKDCIPFRISFEGTEIDHAGRKENPGPLLQRRAIRSVNDESGCQFRGSGLVHGRACWFFNLKTVGMEFQACPKSAEHLPSHFSANEAFEQVGILIRVHGNFGP